MDDPEVPVIGYITRASLDREGRLLLLDSQLSRIVVVGTAGNIVRMLSGAGDGPGESRSASSLVSYPNGDIGLLQIWPAKLVRLSKEGEPMPSVFAEDQVQKWWDCAAFEDGLVVCGEGVVESNPESGIEEKRLWLAVLDGYGRERRVIYEKLVKLDWNNLWHDEGALTFPRHTWAVGIDGSIVLARDRDQYRLEFISPTG